jgi:tape measure domain-containing protein
MQSTISAIAKVKAKGKLGGEALDMLADAGVGTGAILDAIGKTRGLTRDQVQKLVSAGSISADEGVAAISQAVANTLSGGKLGQATLEAGKSVTGMLSTLASRPFDLFMKADAQGAFDGFKRLLQVVIDATDPEKAGGARFVEMFQKLSDAGKAFVDAISSEGMKTFINLAAELLSSGIDMYLALMSGTMKGFGDVMKPSIEGIIKFTRDPAKMERLSQVIYGVSYAVGALFAVIGPNVEFTMKLLDQASETFHTFFDPYMDAWTTASATFTQLRDYIAELMGINPSTATWETWIARILELVRGAMERVRSMIGGTLSIGGVGNVLAGAGGPLGMLGPGAPMTVLGGAATPANTQQNTKNFNASGMVIQVNATDPATGQSVGQRTGNAAAGALKEFFEGIAK